MQMFALNMQAGPAKFNFLISRDLHGKILWEPMDFKLSGFD